MLDIKYLMDCDSEYHEELAKRYIRTTSGNLEPRVMDGLVIVHYEDSTKSIIIGGTSFGECRYFLSIYGLYELNRRKQ